MYMCSLQEVEGCSSPLSLAYYPLTWSLEYIKICSFFTPLSWQFCGKHCICRPASVSTNVSTSVNVKENL